jgi:hypothetical protein
MSELTSLSHSPGVRHVHSPLSSATLLMEMNVNVFFFPLLNLCFLGAAPLVTPPPLSPVDYFRNRAPVIHWLYELCKVLICLSIVALRLALLLRSALQS